MRVLVTGAGGLLGSAVSEAARSRGHDVLCGVRPGGSSAPVPEWSVELDVTDAGTVGRVMSDVAPDAVVHCAAYTDVDAAEAEPHEAMAVNVDGTRTVSRAAAASGSLVLYPSSDYVFDGAGPGPYEPDDERRPLNAYGRSKKAAEDALRRAAGRWLIVRTSWLYGAGGDNFVDTVLARAWEREVVQAVGDQVGRPTWTGSLAGPLVELLEMEARGRVLHLADRGEASWYDLAREAYRVEGITASLVPISSDEWDAPAERPRNSVLDISAAEECLGRPMPHWKESLQRYLGERS